MPFLANWRIVLASHGGAITTEVATVAVRRLFNYSRVGPAYYAVFDALCWLERGSNSVA